MYCFALCDEVVAERVHEVEDTGRAVGLPPFGGENIEVGNFIGGNGGVLATLRREDVALRNPRRGSEELGELS